MSLETQLTTFIKPLLKGGMDTTVKEIVAEGAAHGEVMAKDALTLTTRKAAKPSPQATVDALLQSRPKRFKDLGSFQSYATALIDFVTGLKKKVDAALNKSARLEMIHNTERTKLYQPLNAAKDKLTHIQGGHGGPAAQALLVKAGAEGGVAGELATRYQALLKDAEAAAELNAAAAEATFDAKLKPFETALGDSRDKLRALEDPIAAAQNEFYGLRTDFTPDMTEGWKPKEFFEAGAHWEKQYQRIAPKGA